MSQKESEAVELFRIGIDCNCQPDRGVTCFRCLSASRLRIMAREFERYHDYEIATELFNLADRLGP